MPKDKQHENVRIDIQALRALAIVAVVVYHVWPNRLTGGFVGVDIFFAISGYLITGQLWRQQLQTSKIDFKQFWIRRARRLLPASLLVILVTAIATYFLTTPSWFLKIQSEGIGAIFYAQNWVLVGKVTDYLTNDGTKSPFQHFWSLSVEEQYYIFWPMLLLLILITVRSFKALKAKSTLVVLLVGILISSLGFSIWLTYTSPQNAYFNTFTRAWEFAAGALLAVITNGESGKAKNRSPIWFWVGSSLMMLAIVTFSDKTPFPSWWAAIPVGGAVLVIFSGQSSSRFIPNRFLKFKPVQFIGDISYSLYLWHWPVLILAPWVLHRVTLVWDELVIVLISIVLAWASKRFVEDPVRFGAISQLKLSMQFATFGTAVAVLLVSISGLGAVADSKFKSISSSIQLQPPLDNLGGGAKAKESSDCKIGPEGTGFKTCQRGDQTGKIRVALIGDSHTRQWFVPLDDIAFNYGWNITMISKSACTLVDPATYPAYLANPSCQGWNQQLLEYLAGVPAFDLIINSNSSLETMGRKDVADSFASMVKQLTANGHTKFFEIHDSPKPDPNFVPCIEMWMDQASVKCAVSRKQGLTPADVLPAAIKDLPSVTVADFTDEFCSAQTCPPVIENIVVYRDNSHITSTWAKQLQPLIEAALPTGFKKN